MNNILLNLRRRATPGLAAVIACILISTLETTHAAPPKLEALGFSDFAGEWPAWQGKWPKLPRGDVSHVVLADGRAYVALLEAGLAVIDVRNPANPVPIGSCDGFARRVAVSGDYAYVVNGNGLAVVDVRNPANCVPLGSFYNIPSVDVAVLGHYAYVALFHGGLAILDVSDPTNIERVGGYDGGGAFAVALAGNHAYLADVSGLQVIDVSDPANCVRVGGFKSAMGDPRAVTVSGRYAYVALNPVGMEVIDVSDPANCVRIGGFYTTLDAPLDVDVAVSGNHAYVAGWAGTGINPIGFLQIVNVSDPTNCVRVGGYETNEYVRAVAVAGSHAYVAEGKGVQIIDVSDPTNYVRVGGPATSGVDGVGADVSADGNYAYIADGSAGLQVIEVINPGNSVHVGGYSGLGEANTVTVAGGYAYLADGDGMQVIDVSNPTNCVRVGGYDTDGHAYAVTVADNYAYLADSTGLQVIDVRDPNNCVRVGGCDISGDPRAGAVVVSGKYAYVAHQLEGLLVIDVSDRSNCVRVCRFDTAFDFGCCDLGPGTYTWSTLAVAVSGNRAYVVASATAHSPGLPPGGTFQVIDVSNPTNCVRVGLQFTRGYAYDVAISGNYAFVANEAGLDVVNVSDPANCVHVASYDFVGARGVAAASGGIYLSGRLGLRALPTLPDAQFTLRVDATPGLPFTLEAATDLSAPFPWIPLLTTNVPAMPFDFVDYDMKRDKPQKLYRVRQP